MYTNIVIFLKANSSVGRVAVSKTVGRGFESYFACQEKQPLLGCFLSCLLFSPRLMLRILNFSEIFPTTSPVGSCITPTSPDKINLINKGKD